MIQRKTKKTTAKRKQAVKKRTVARRRVARRRRTAGPKILVGMALDRSGSVLDWLDQAIAGFNEWLGTLQADRTANYFLTLTAFNTEFEVLQAETPIRRVPKLTHQTFRPRGNTALHDAVARTILALEERLAGKSLPVLVVIQTDGKENMSRNYSRQQVYQMIREREDRGNWTFVFLGADQDAWRAGAAIGIAPQNTLNYVHAENFGAMRGLAAATQSYAVAVARGASPTTHSFFRTDTDVAQPGTVPRAAESDFTVVAPPDDPDKTAAPTPDDPSKESA
jgi:hypothetical protein